MTQAGLCHTVIGTPPESCWSPSPNASLGGCLAEARPSYSPVRAGSGAAGTAKQPHLSRETALRESAQPEQSSAATLPRACGGRGGIARGVRRSMRLPEVDRIGIRG